MKGVIIKGLHEVAVEERDRPVIEQPTDVILKMRVAGLCGKSQTTLPAKRGWRQMDSRNRF